MLTFLLIWAALAGVLYIWNDNTQLPDIRPTVYRRFITVVLLPWAYVLLLALSVISILETCIKAVKSEVNDLRYTWGNVKPSQCWNGKSH